MAQQTAKKVFKYALGLYDTVTIEMPIGARVIHVDAQGPDVCIWAIVDPREMGTGERTFHIAGTGHDLPKDCIIKHIGTVMMQNGKFVWHVFEELKYSTK